MPDENPLLRGDSLIAYDQVTLEHLRSAVAHVLESAGDAVLERIIERQQSFPTWDDLVLAVEALEARLQGAVYAFLPLHTRGQAWADLVIELLIDVDTWFKQKDRNLRLYNLYQRLADSDIGRNLSHDKRQTLQKRLHECRLAGVLLDEPGRERLALLDMTIVRLRGEFGTNLDEALYERGILVEDPHRLEGIPRLERDEMAAHAQAAGLEGWLIPCREHACKAVLEYAKDRALREQVYRAYHTRGSSDDPERDNGHVIQAWAQAWQERAQLLGFPDHVAFSRQEKNLGCERDARRFLETLLAKVRPLLHRQWQALLSLARKQGLDKVEPWDIDYLRQRLDGRVATVDEDQMRAFFPLDSVVAALVQLTHELFGITLAPVTSVKAWHPSVLTFALVEDHATIGHLYVDAVEWEGKQAGSVHTNYHYNRRIDAEGLYHGPIATVFSDTPPGGAGAPPLLDHLALRKLFHEFGHALQHLLVRTNNHLLSDTRRLGRVGNEVGSKLLERWAWSAQFLASISSHYQTGRKLPVATLRALLERLQADAVGEIAQDLTRSLFDLDLHRNVKDGRTLQARIEDSHNQVFARPLADFERPMHAFEHLVSGYDASYYAYLWSDAHAMDLFTRFEQEGLRNGATGRELREMFISGGASRSLAQSVEDFLGRPLNLDAYLRWNGLLGVVE